MLTIRGIQARPVIVPFRIPPVSASGAMPRAALDLIDLDPLVGELIAHPVADAVVSGVLGPEYIVSNFTANIARPGSASMVVHSDQAAVMPEPWVVPQTVNVIWCLTDVRPPNGATRHNPATHPDPYPAVRPPDPIAHNVAFEAPAG